MENVGMATCRANTTTASESPGDRQGILTKKLSRSMREAGPVLDLPHCGSSPFWCLSKKAETVDGSVEFSESTFVDDEAIYPFARTCAALDASILATLMI